MTDEELIKIMANEISRLERENFIFRARLKKQKIQKKICRNCNEFAEKQSGTGICTVSNIKVKSFEECKL